jgi:hypothetical protein
MSLSWEDGALPELPDVQQLIGLDYKDSLVHYGIFYGPLSELSILNVHGGINLVRVMCKVQYMLINIIQYHQSRWVLHNDFQSTGPRLGSLELLLRQQCILMGGPVCC